MVLINSSWLNYIITAIAISISRFQGVNPEVRKSLGISPLAAMLVSLFLIFSSLAYIDAKGWVKIIINVFVPSTIIKINMVLNNVIYIT